MLNKINKKKYKQRKEKLIFTLTIANKEIRNHGRGSKNWFKLINIFEITHNG